MQEIIETLSEKLSSQTIVVFGDGDEDEEENDDDELEIDVELDEEDENGNAPYNPGDDDENQPSNN